MMYGYLKMLFDYDTYMIFFDKENSKTIVPGQHIFPKYKSIDLQEICSY